MKTAKEMTSDILSSLRDENNPLAILIEGYLEKCIKDHVNSAKDELLKSITELIDAEDGKSVIYDVKGLVELFNK
jgi:hypothetical protein